MTSRFRWLAGAMAGFILLASVIALAPRPLPAVPPPVRLEGSLQTASVPTQSELVVVPSPSVALRAATPVEVAPTTSPSAPPSTTGQPPTSAGDDAGSGDDTGDAAGSDDGSADSPDD